MNRIQTLSSGFGRSIQNPAVPLSGSKILQYLGGAGASQAGVSVTSSTALEYAPVWQAVTQISGDIAKMPLNLYRVKEGVREVALDSDKHRLVRRPNEMQNWNKFWRRALVHVLIWNRAYIWIRGNRSGDAQDLLLLLPDRTRYLDKSNMYVSELSGEDKPVAFFPSEIVEIESIQFSGANECELLRKFRDSVGMGLAAQNFNSRFFQNGGQPGGILEVPPHFTKTAMDNLEEGWRKKYDDPSSHFKTVILRDGAKFHQVTVDAESSQMHEMRTDQVREVARWYNLPPSRLGLEDASSYNSKAEDNQNYLDMTLSPWLAAIKSELDFKLLSEAEQAEGLGYGFDTSALLALNPILRAETHKLEIEMGKKNPNECRGEDGLPPRAGGDEYRLPSGVVPETSIATEAETENETEQQNSSSMTEDQIQSVSEALQRFIKGVCTRVKKEANRKDAMRFCDWFDDSSERWTRLNNDRLWSICRLCKNSRVALEVAGQIGVQRLRARINQILETCCADSAGEVQVAVTEVCEYFETLDWNTELRNAITEQSNRKAGGVAA